ncbi:hypothetical protein EPA93_37755 [Ktedonosporobacter rubrisoli]|uniref:Pyridoxamine 5'-phosphate oxidase N-terminal domain-containing protein n=1 Tax=Ktedonosporobacter rubrisoli TaxID=2509675 RepID=A0A4P6K060_KTERU|nr:pyridoxamine 5'-phosphate oxidase family protein [Ktedonosporobacter rubrisoli]QBD81414.1 hypothetical protein EPA93_37755 [Ktedonosporobacter rubrisoli]
MRKNLQVSDLGDLLDLPLNAVLATHLANGDILLSPIWHEWQDGGFNLIIGANDIKHRSLQGNPRASISVFETSDLNRGLEVRGKAKLGTDNDHAVLRRIALRYVGPEQVDAYLQTLKDAELVLVRLEPGKLRAWDFADEI